MNVLIDYVKNYTEQPFMHKHKYYEIITYVDGNGYFIKNGVKTNIAKGQIVVVPPNVVHGSCTKEKLRTIYVVGDLGCDFAFNEVVIINDTQDGEGMCLANLIYNNRYGNKEYLRSLCNAYVSFIMKNIKIDGGINQTIREIARQIERNFYNVDLRVNDLLIESGYAEDYVRYNFKKVTGKTPIEYLTEIRIKHAIRYIEVYGNSLQLYEIAQNCGYDDYIYFSRKFKQVTGISPKEYKDKGYTQTK